jgi:CHAT domain-containing protein/plasmid stabilization system protein ParE
MNRESSEPGQVPELSFWELPLAFRDDTISAKLSYDGQVYHRCSSCSSEVRIHPAFASAEHEFPCDKCGEDAYALVRHLAACDFSCLDCGMPSSVSTSGAEPISCPNCGSGHLSLNNVSIVPPFPSSFAQGYGFREALTAPELLSAILEEPRWRWGVSAAGDVREVMTELSYESPRPDFPRYIVWAVRFLQRLHMFGGYQKDNNSAATFLNMEGNLLHDYARRTQNLTAALESVEASRAAIALDMHDPLNLALEEHNLAIRVYTALVIGNDVLIALMTGNKGFRAEGVAAARRALAYFEGPDGASWAGAPQQIARIHWALGDLLKSSVPDTAVHDILRSAVGSDLAPEDLDELVDWLIGDDSNSREQADDRLREAVEHLSQALGSGLLEESWVHAVRDSRAVAILEITARTPELEQLAVADFENAINAPEFTSRNQAFGVLYNYANLKLESGDQDGALYLLERACVMLLAAIDQATDEETLRYATNQAVDSFAALARTYAALDRPREALNAIETLRAATVRMRTMTPEELEEHGDRAQRALVPSVVGWMIRMLGDEPTGDNPTDGDLAGDEPAEAPLEALKLDLSQSDHRIAKGLLDRFRGSSVAFVSIDFWRDAVIAVVARPAAANTQDHSIESLIWTADLMEFNRDLTMTSLEPSVWREERLRKICDTAYDVIWAPLAANLLTNGVDEMVVSVPGGGVNIVPLELMELRHSEQSGHAPRGISYLPALGVGADLAAPKMATRTPSQRLLVVKYQGTDLPGADQELEMLKQLWTGQVTVFDGKRHAKTSLIEALAADYDCVHFACHGSYDEESPLDSSLHLIPEANRDSERLTARDLLSIRLGGRPLVVLSACSSVVTAPDNVGDCTGLLGGFIRAGASGVLGSRWPVYDDAALEFMRRFYLELRQGQGPYHATRRAQLSMRHDWAIEDWSAFAYIGIPEPIANDGV